MYQVRVTRGVEADGCLDGIATATGKNQSDSRSRT